MFKLYEVLILACFNDKRVWHQIETPSNIQLARAIVRSESNSDYLKGRYSYLQVYYIWDISTINVCMGNSSLQIFFADICSSLWGVYKEIYWSIQQTETPLKHLKSKVYRMRDNRAKKLAWRHQLCKKLGKL